MNSTFKHYFSNCGKPVIKSWKNPENWEILAATKSLKQDSKTCKPVTDKKMCLHSHTHTHVCIYRWNIHAHTFTFESESWCEGDLNSVTRESCMNLHNANKHSVALTCNYDDSNINMQATLKSILELEQLGLLIGWLIW